MPLDSTDITALLAARKPRECAYWKISWNSADSAQDRYYSDSIYNQMSGFLNIGLSIEAQILVGKDSTLARDIAFDLNPDIKTEKISIKFNDIAVGGVKPISSRFQTYKSGVRAELFFYYPDVDEHQSVFLGQLQAPDIYGHDSVSATVTNGFRSREQQIPKRTRPRECTANFGGTLPNQEAIDSNGCPYNKHIGGSVGAFKTGTTPYVSCPRNSPATCDTRMGTSDGKYFLGFDTDASATVTSGNPRVGPAISKGNQSALTKPIRRIYGQKYVREMPLLLWRRETGAPNPDHDWVSGISEVGDGPYSQVYDLKVLGGKPPQHIATQIRLGTLGQAPVSNYATTVENFSYTALVRWKFGWINAKETSASDMTCEGRVLGAADVPVFTDDDPQTYSRIWSDNRVWCLLDLMSSKRFGAGYPFSRFEIADWITAAAWTNNTVSFEAVDKDGNDVTYAGRRSTFDAVCEGRPFAEQIEDICRAGALSVPFLHNGKFTIRPFRKATTDELNNARVFTDAGSTPNIVWDGKRPAITFGQIPDDKIINEVQLEFEEADNEDVARPVTVDSPDQKLKAGRVLGDDNLQSVPKKFSAFGCRYLHEVVRLGYRLLWFGDQESGGTQNNLNGTFTTPYIQTHGLKRYDIIKIESTLDDDFTIGTDNGDWDLEETPSYYRIMSWKKVANGLAEVKVQAYNHTAYSLLDNVTDTDLPVFNACSIDADCPSGYICVDGVCVIEPPPPPDVLVITGISYDAANTLLEVDLS